MGNLKKEDIRNIVRNSYKKIAVGNIKKGSCCNSDITLKKFCCRDIA